MLPLVVFPSYFYCYFVFVIGSFLHLGLSVHLFGGCLQGLFVFRIENYLLHHFFFG